MKRKQLFIGIILGIILIALIGWFINRNNNQTKFEEEEKQQITPLMFEITKEGSTNKIYLFGSIHMANLDEFDFPNYVINAYNDSSYLACEFDTVAYEKDQDRILNDTLKMLYDDGTTIKEHIKEETYHKLVNFLTEKKLYLELYDVYKPYLFETLLTTAILKDAKINTNTGIDSYFIKKAKSDNKTILEVETSDFQMDLLLSFSDELYELIINDVIDNYDEEVNALIQLYAAWKKGDPKEIQEFSDDDLDIKENYTKKQISLINDYNQKVIDNRNTTMTNKLIEYFNNNQDVFYMVGTLHLIGDTGIAHQLELKGYTVKQINN